VKKIRFGILGVGRIGRLHLENLYSRISEAEVTRISDANTQTIETVLGHFPQVEVSSSPEDLMKDSEVDAVAICSSTDTHASFIVEAARNKKHIFCEKPIDLSLEKIGEAIEAVRESGVTFQVGFNRRFDPNFSQIAQQIKNNDIGKVHSLRITSRDPEPPPVDYVKKSGGLFLDMAIHDFDMARYLLQDEVEEVYAVGGNFIDPEIGAAGDIDSAICTIKFKNGTLCTIDNSRKAVFGYDQRVEAFGEEGCLSCENMSANRVHYWNKDGAHQRPPFHFFLDRYTDSYLIEMREFVRNVLDQREPSVAGRDGLEAVRIGMAAKKSLDENRPVKLEEI